MTLDQEQPPALERRSRDPERTKEEILVVATQEFAERGFAGARVDEIASQTRTTKRMIYYYYGSKERLYLAALERAYEDIRVTEASVDVEHLDPVTAVRTLAQLTFDRHEANPDFSRLISQENVQRAQFVSAASGFPGLDRPIVKMLDHALERVVEHLDDRTIQTGEPTRRRDELGALNVFLADQTAEVRIGLVTVEGQLRERAHGGDRIEMLDVDARFGDPDVLVRALERRQIKTLFGAVVVIDHPLGGARLARDLVYACSRETTLGELLGRDDEDLLFRAFGIARTTLECGWLFLV